MGMIITCDIDDCHNSDIDMKMYSILDNKVKDIINFDYYQSDICEECLEQILKDSNGEIIIDPEDDDYVIYNEDFEKDLK